MQCLINMAMRVSVFEFLRCYIMQELKIQAEITKYFHVRSAWLLCLIKIVLRAHYTMDVVAAIAAAFCAAWAADNICNLMFWVRKWCLASVKFKLKTLLVYPTADQTIELWDCSHVFTILQSFDKKYATFCWHYRFLQKKLSALEVCKQPPDSLNNLSSFNL